MSAPMMPSGGGMPPGPGGPSGVMGGLTPEQAQIVQIAVSDPAILAGIAETLTGGGAAIDPQLLASLSGQGGGMPPGAPSGPSMERRLLG